MTRLPRFLYKIILVSKEENHGVPRILLVIATGHSNLTSRKTQDSGGAHDQEIGNGNGEQKMGNRNGEKEIGNARQSGRVWSMCSNVEILEKSRSQRSQPSHEILQPFIDPAHLTCHFFFIYSATL
jgi:hypothetical protein